MGWGTVDTKFPGMGSSTPRDAIAARLVLAIAALLVALAWDLRFRLDDEMGAAAWIGLPRAAREGKPATVVFLKRFVLPFDVPDGRILVRGDRDYELLLDGRTIAASEPGAPPARLDVWGLPGPLAAGEHTVGAIVRHPEGVASLRLSLDLERVGRNGVVTGEGWLAGDDEKRFRDRGSDGARYEAAPWARPPLSPWDSPFSSSIRSWRGRAGVSNTIVNSRIPDRAWAQ